MSKRTFFILVALLAVVYAGSAGGGFFQSNDGVDVSKEDANDPDGLKRKLQKSGWPSAMVSGLGELFVKQITPDDIEPSDGEEPRLAYSIDQARGRIVFHQVDAEYTLRFQKSFFFTPRSLRLSVERGEVAVDAPIRGPERQTVSLVADQPQASSVACSVGNDDFVVIKCIALGQGEPVGESSASPLECVVRIGQ